MEDMTGIEVLAVSTIIRSLLPRAKELLERNGCKVSTWGDKEHVLIIFPQGTTRTELYPQTQEARYRLKFPSGLELREVALPGKEYRALFADTPSDKKYLRGSSNEQTQAQDTRR